MSLFFKFQKGKKKGLPKSREPPSPSESFFAPEPPPMPPPPLPPFPYGTRFAWPVGQQRGQQISQSVVPSPVQGPSLTQSITRIVTHQPPSTSVDSKPPTANPTSPARSHAAKNPTSPARSHKPSGSLASNLSQPDLPSKDNVPSSSAPPSIPLDFITPGNDRLSFDEVFWARKSMSESDPKNTAGQNSNSNATATAKTGTTPKQPPAKPSALQLQNISTYSPPVPRASSPGASSYSSSSGSSIYTYVSAPDLDFDDYHLSPTGRTTHHRLTRTDSFTIPADMWGWDGAGKDGDARSRKSGRSRRASSRRGSSVRDPRRSRRYSDGGGTVASVSPGPWSSVSGHDSNSIPGIGAAGLGESTAKRLSRKASRRSSRQRSNPSISAAATAAAIMRNSEAEPMPDDALEKVRMRKSPGAGDNLNVDWRKYWLPSAPSPALPPIPPASAASTSAANASQDKKGETCPKLPPISDLLGGMSTLCNANTNASRPAPLTSGSPLPTPPSSGSLSPPFPHANASTHSFSVSDSGSASLARSISTDATSASPLATLPSTSTSTTTLPGSTSSPKPKQPAPSRSLPAAPATTTVATPPTSPPTSSPALASENSSSATFPGSMSNPYASARSSPASSFEEVTLDSVLNGYNTSPVRNRSGSVGTKVYQPRPHQSQHLKQVQAQSSPPQGVLPPVPPQPPQVMALSSSPPRVLPPRVDSMAAAAARGTRERSGSNATVNGTRDRSGSVSNNNAATNNVSTSEAHGRKRSGSNASDRNGAAVGIISNKAPPLHGIAERDSVDGSVRDFRSNSNADARRRRPSNADAGRRPSGMTESRRPSTEERRNDRRPSEKERRPSNLGDSTSTARGTESRESGDITTKDEENEGQMDQAKGNGKGKEKAVLLSPPLPSSSLYPVPGTNQWTIEDPTPNSHTRKRTDSNVAIKGGYDPQASIDEGTTGAAPGVSTMGAKIPGSTHANETVSSFINQSQTSLGLIQGQSSSLKSQARSGSSNKSSTSMMIRPGTAMSSQSSISDKKGASSSIKDGVMGAARGALAALMGGGGKDKTNEVRRGSGPKLSVDSVMRVIPIAPNDEADIDAEMDTGKEQEDMKYPREKLQATEENAASGSVSSLGYTNPNTFAKLTNASTVSLTGKQGNVSSSSVSLGNNELGRNASGYASVTSLSRNAHSRNDSVTSLKRGYPIKPLQSTNSSGHLSQSPLSDPVSPAPHPTSPSSIYGSDLGSLDASYAGDADAPRRSVSASVSTREESRTGSPAFPKFPPRALSDAGLGGTESGGPRSPNNKPNKSVGDIVLAPQTPASASSYSQQSPMSNHSVAPPNVPSDSSSKDRLSTAHLVVGGTSPAPVGHRTSTTRKLPIGNRTPFGHSRDRSNSDTRPASTLSQTALVFVDDTFRPQRRDRPPPLHPASYAYNAFPMTPHDDSPILTPPPMQKLFSPIHEESTAQLNNNVPKPSVIEPTPGSNSQRRARPVGPRTRSARATAAVSAERTTTANTVQAVPANNNTLVNESSNSKSTSYGHSPSTPKFVTRPVQWRGLTMDAAKWTFTSSQLQDIVGRAIRQTAEASSIRLLTLKVYDEEIPAEIQRLEASKAELTGKYRSTVHRRNILLHTLALLDSSTKRAQVQQELVEVSHACDQLTQDMFLVMDQLQQLHKLRDVHSASALAMALRKLNSSLLKQSADMTEMSKHMTQLEAERDEAWATAERVEHDLVELQAKMDAMCGGGSEGGTNSSLLSNRSSRVSAARKTSIRASKADLRLSHGTRSSHASSSRSSHYRVSSFAAPPVPPVPRLLYSPTSRKLSLNTDLASASGHSTYSTGSGLGVSPTIEKELYDMLGISRTDTRPRHGHSLRRPNSVLALSSPASLPATPYSAFEGSSPPYAGVRRNASFSMSPRPVSPLPEVTEFEKALLSL